MLASKFFSFICLGVARFSGRWFLGCQYSFTRCNNDTKGVTIELQGKLNKGIKVFPISAKTSEGMTDWYDWLVKSVEKNSVQY